MKYTRVMVTSGDDHRGRIRYTYNAYLAIATRYTPAT